MDHRIVSGDLLRHAREDQGISLAAMAARTHYSKSHLGNVETGQRAVTADVVVAYERECGDLERRGLLASTAAIAVAPMATAELIYRGFSAAAHEHVTVDHWQDRVRALGQSYMSEGAAALQPRIAGDLVILQGQLGRPALWGVASRYLTTFGKTTPGAREATRWYGLAAVAADRSGDDETRVWVRGRSALALAYEGAGLATAARLADEALAISGRPTLGRLNALIARAHVAAFRHDLAAMEESVGEALRVFDLAGSSEQISDFAVPEWRLWTFLSMLYSRLGDEKRAVRAQDAADAVRPATLQRFATHIEMHRGLMIARSGDHAGGEAYARRALDRLPPERHSLTLRLMMEEVTTPRRHD
jgi:transcriptional regulator with XRE-family HTH domain